MQTILGPIPGHSIMLLLLQLAGLLLLARALAEAFRRRGQPAVIGELLAGIVLGPTVLGRVAPTLFAAAFPPEVEQFHLLEVISWLGMVLLLLLTGLETDLRAMRNLGRAAVSASLFGMVVPFAAGFTLGWVLPDAYLTDPADRLLFAAFLATAMAISALPVIAKILIDLGLVRRNVGMVILSAAVVDDTTGWLVLSVIAGIAAEGFFSLRALATTLLWLALFLAAARWIAYPALTGAVRYVNERVDLVGADLTLILGSTFLAAAATEAMGIHAVFGAFVAGLLFRQIPRIRPASLRALEVFVLSALSPLFFAFVGLKVDLWALSSWGVPMAVLGVAIGGKLVGCYVGGRVGRLSHWESLALGFGMNARGAMELIVALIGLSLGLLTQEMYSTIVLIAIVTSLMAPVLLRWASPRLPLSDEERSRIRDDLGERLIPTGPLRVLVPTAGGRNAMAAIELAAPLARRSHAELVALFVETGDAGRPGKGTRGGAPAPGTNLEAHFGLAAEVVGRGHFSGRRVAAGDLVQAVLDEAARDFDFLFMGAAPEQVLGGATVRRIVRGSPIPVVILQDRRAPTDPPFARLLVPVDGSLFSRYAAELAFAYAGAGGAHVSILHVASDRHHLKDAEGQLVRELGPLAVSHGASMSVRIRLGEAPGDVIVDEALGGDDDLLILGTEARLMGRPSLFGQGTAEILERARCSTAVVLAAVGRRTARQAS